MRGLQTSENQVDRQGPRFRHLLGSWRKVARTSAIAALSAGVILGLSGCIEGPITLSGSGTTVVTVGWSGTVTRGQPEGYPFPIGDLLIICSVDEDSCNTESGLFLVFLPENASEMQLTTSTPVYSPLSSSFVPLPQGRYLMVALGADVESETPGVIGEPMLFTLTDGMDRTIWYQSIARDDASSACPDGWEPSWAQWHHDGAGGYVCNMESYMYYPDIPVAGFSSETDDTSWRQSFGRASADTSCPDGFAGSWAQWPNDGKGGYVCNKKSASRAAADAAASRLATARLNLDKVDMDSVQGPLNQVIGLALKAFGNVTPTSGN